ncbi:MAG TPA: hypothetical protein VNU48_11680 [Burkholderiaceae bacterium]|nr:hypothetical protein [Burkholderiaceae bacterium]
MNPTQMPDRRGAVRGDARRPGAPIAREGTARGKADWVARCARRLRVLNPACDVANAHALALDLWAEVGYFDPEMAAELELESSATDD